METIFQRFNKEQAGDYVNEMTATFGDVCQAANIVKETAKKFDGKCLNVRFLRAVNEQCAKIQGAMAVRVYENSSHTLEFSPRRCRYNISHDFCLCIWDFTTKITNAENRIQYKEVEACVDKLNEQLTNSLSRYVDAVEHWDDYMAKMDEIGRMLVEKIADINGLFVPSDLKLVRGVNWRIETKM